MFSSIVISEEHFERNLDIGCVRSPHRYSGQNSHLKAAIKFYENDSLKNVFLQNLRADGIRGMFANIYQIKLSKGKAVPLQVWSGPEGSRKLRFPDFMTTAQVSGMVNLTHRPPLPTRK